MKKVYLNTIHRLHSLEDSLLKYPPEGYKIIFKEKAQRVVLAQTRKFGSGVHYFGRKSVEKVINLKLLKVFLDKIEKLPEDIDLIYSAGYLVLKPKPWVVDTECVTEFINYKVRDLPRYKKLLEKIFASKWCKKILPFTDVIAKTILLNLDCKNFKDKIETIHIAVTPKKFKKKHNKRKVRLLFVSSKNVDNILRGFEDRAGRDAVEAFLKLNKKYDDLELVLRSYVPEDIKKKCQGIDNIKIIDEIIPWKDMEHIFKTTDILFLPAHEWIGQGILDGMSYELPVVTTGIGGNSEMVKDGKTGILIKESKNIQYYIKNFIPNNTPEYRKSISKIHPEIVDDLVKKTSILIENKNLRRKMGKAGRREIEKGEFSIEARNKKLKKIFDEATT